MTTARASDREGPTDAAEVEALIPVLRRVVRARVGSHPQAEDLVQETLARVLAARERIEPGMLEPYAIATARNVVASLWRQGDRAVRNAHRLFDPGRPDGADDVVIATEQTAAVGRALAQLSEDERRLLLAHEVTGQDTRSLAEAADSTAGAVAARLKRIRARLRVEYLLALDDVEPPSDRCRAVLVALSGADRRRQDELDTERHLLECPLCARLSEPLVERGPVRSDEAHVPIAEAADIVTARHRARELAARAGFDGVDLTLIATAVSEMARNIVRFADNGEVSVRLLDRPRRGIRVIVRDTGPGIPDVDRALQDGYSTDEGLGLGLPGARRLMDEFLVESSQGNGTTVKMTKWIKRG
ncbi:sigma-70 family RNA polymerase sigma factor [Ornithinimicrobium cavernae]|uniref:sigma-70 family RNA polymerase sigma factor n=1 Tax=Ornithinimicrobium cavernae TaxID=2666047 RepID=UPI000D68FD46|nr:sigma-70 family RNA polymerase sigma factor [Ornithinimicrobium cavernae]